MQLCGSEEDILKETETNGKLNDRNEYRVNYSDIFSSPWCCDFSHEDRYEVLMQEVSVSIASLTSTIYFSLVSSNRCTT